MDLIKYKSILEIGSGMGNLPLLLKDRGFVNYTGIELDSDACIFSQEMLADCSSIDNNFYNQLIDSYSKNSQNKFNVFFCI